MRLVGSERDRRETLWQEMLDYSKDSAEWSRTLTAPEADRWQGRIEGYGDAINLLGAAPFIDATVSEFAATLARGCSRFSHLPSQQRMRAYKRAARVRSVNAERNESILQDRAAGLSQRRLAARYGVSRGCVEKVIVSAKKPPETAPAITAKKPPRAAPISQAKNRSVCAQGGFAPQAVPLPCQVSAVSAVPHLHQPAAIEHPTSTLHHHGCGK